MKLWNSPAPVWEGEGAAAGAAADAGADKKPDPAAADPNAAAADAGDGAKQDGGSFLDNADKSDPKVDALKPTDWPEDWRDRMAGGDEAMRKRLDRFKAPADVFKSYTELEGKFKKGTGPGDEPMPDPEKEPEKAKEWRTARGIPDDPTGYTIPDAVKSLVGDADKPRLASFTEAMHKQGIPAKHVGPVMEWYFQEQAAAAEAISTADKADRSETEESLREEWGPDFRPNSTIAKRFAEEVTPGLNWFSARLPDGRTLGNVPEFVKALAELGRERYGDVSFAGTENTNRTMARKEALETMMRDDPDGYAANPKLSKEYEAIMEAEIKNSGRSGAGNHSPKP